MLDALGLEAAAAIIANDNGEGYPINTSSASDASDAKKPATTIDATSFDTEAHRTATRVHREATRAGPHT